MTIWEFLDKLAAIVPPFAAGGAVIAATVIFLVGFSKHGMNFIKYGFKQKLLANELMEKLATKEDISRLDAKISAIETNHFGHLKNYLEILNGILLDKEIISNQEKTRLDNELRGM